MAKLHGPLFSLDARGQFGKTLVYSIWKGLNYARKYVIPSNPNTAAQQTIRGYFSAAVAAYKAEDQATKDAWDVANTAIGKPMTGFNYYLGLYVKYQIDNTGTPPVSPFMPPS